MSQTLARKPGTPQMSDTRVKGRADAAIPMCSPNTLAWITLLIGFYSAFPLAIVNWFRMGRPVKAALHIVAGLALTTAWIVGFSLFINAGNPWLSYLVAVGINIFILTYLRLQMKADMEEGARRGLRFKDINPWQGWLLIALGWVVTLVVEFTVMMVMRILSMVISGVPFSS